MDEFRHVHRVEIEGLGERLLRSEVPDDAEFKVEVHDALPKRKVVVQKPKVSALKQPLIICRLFGRQRERSWKVGL